ncbi:MAG: septum site-determining protein MinC [Syntrophomonadaceae bacterium]|jgi:septum site-determining protein MinC|nr:septum site-determining protein MinC [Syntrophomonadaceae bacterium]
MPNKALKKNTADMIPIDLKGMRNFSEIKAGLEEKIRVIDDFMLGTSVVINIEKINLKAKQIRELEDLLLDYGFHLKDIIKTETKAAEDKHQENKLADDSNEMANMPLYENTALICRHLRSGQKIFSEGNIVVLGDINPGAEVIAGGNILVMGSLRGLAHAGAFGDDSALIAAYRLNPTQLRIANHITRPPDGEVVDMETPELARIKAGKVVIEKLKI